MISVQRVSDILRDSWDPIGLRHDGPRDEYEVYAPQVHEVLRNSTTNEEALTQIASYLTWVRVTVMGLERLEDCRRDAFAATVLVKEGRS